MGELMLDLNMAFQFPIRIYWEDTDAGGIVFYANYLKFFERARTEWLRSLGIEQQALKSEVGGMFVVSETHLKYHRPAQLDNLLTVTAELAEAGRATVTLRQQALLETPGLAPQLLAEGTIRIGWVDSHTLKPGRIPATILKALQP
jgi:acyl-CoA thioester hydrolase